MPIKINYRGRFGNQLCQYITARIYAEKHQLNLLTPLKTQGILDVNPHKYFPEDDGEFETKKISFLDFDKDDELIYYGRKNYIFHCYFENGDHFSQNEALIRSFFNLPSPDPKYKNDVVIHLRLGDNLKSDRYLTPHPNYFISILKKIKFRNLYIVMQPVQKEWEKNYLKYFENYKYTIISGNERDDFNYFFKFKKIITNYSTFSYWAAFLSKADEIYSFKDFGVHKMRFWFFSIPKISIHKKNFILSKIVLWKHFNIFRTKNMFKIRGNTIAVKSGFIDPKKLL